VNSQLDRRTAPRIDRREPELLIDASVFAGVQGYAPDRPMFLGADAYPRVNVRVPKAIVVKEAPNEERVSRHRGCCRVVTVVGSAWILDADYIAATELTPPGMR
jgi:hypothetical protein